MMKCCLETALARRVCCFRQTSPSLETRRPRHDGSQHGLARCSGPSTRLRQLSHGPEPLDWEGILVRRLAWTDGLRSIATHTSCIKARRLPLLRDLWLRSLRAVSSARNCRRLPGYLSAVDPGSRNRHRPRAAENPRKASLCNASLVLSTDQRKIP